MILFIIVGCLAFLGFLVVGILTVRSIMETRRFKKEIRGIRKEVKNGK